MNIELIGKFYDNHSLTLINRNLALELSKTHNVFITSLDSYDPVHGLSKDTVKLLKELQQKDHSKEEINIQIRHSYPPIWNGLQKKIQKLFISNLGNTQRYLLNGNTNGKHLLIT